MKNEKLIKIINGWRSFADPAKSDKSWSSGIKMCAATLELAIEEDDEIADSCLYSENGVEWRSFAGQDTVEGWIGGIRLCDAKIEMEVEEDEEMNSCRIYSEKEIV